MKGCIYVLRDESGTIFYVGATTKCVYTRLSGHMSCSKKNSSPVYEYIRRNNITPTIEIVQNISFEEKEELWAAEARWVKKLKNKGVILTNVGHTGHYRAKVKSSSIKLDPEVFKDIKAYCAKNGYFLNAFVTKIIQDKINKKK